MLSSIWSRLIVCPVKYLSCLEVKWEGDFFYGKNLAVATKNNSYLDGLSALPEEASHTEPKGGLGLSKLLISSVKC